MLHLGTEPVVLLVMLLWTEMLRLSLTMSKTLKVKVTVRSVRLFVTPWAVLHGILQARIPEWVAVPFSRASFQPRDLTQVSHIPGGFLNS